MAIQGIFASNQGIQGERVGDFSSAILMTNPTGRSLAEFYFGHAEGISERHHVHLVRGLT